jgi:CHAT domain-containing protein
VLSQAAVARGDARGAVEHAERAAAIPGEGWITANDRARQATVLGTALAAAGDHAAAVAAFRSAVACYEQDAAANGIGDGVGQVDVRTRLSASLAALGDAAGSIAERLRALAAFRANVEMMLPAMLERHRLRAVQGARSNLDALLAVAGVRDDLLSGTQQHAEVLAWKGQVARGIERSLAAARANPDTAAALFRLQQLVRESRDPDDRGALRERQALSAKVAASLPARTDRDDAARIASQLEPGEALVDYLLVRGADGGRRFVAFVARPDRPTVRVDLAPHDATCRAVAAHAQLTSRRTRPGLGASTLAADAARAVQDLVWKPLMPALEGADRVVISPDDVLAELPFETLPGAGSGRFLVEDIAIAYLQSGLGLLRAPPSPGPTRVVAIGDVDYGEAAPAGSERGTPVPFAPLPGTRVELADLRGVYGEERVTVLRGADATEPQVAASVAGATHVHLASHGFCTTSEDAGFDVGIALAFANRARRDGARSTDGILTPDEAALLDLRACRVVVLSACQSGLGMPLSGEHLLGLRRALHIAGARTTVTSLWRVDDAATGALMADFHRALWRDELPPALAWRKVQLARIAAQRAAGEVLPGIWGAFVVEGRP